MDWSGPVGIGNIGTFPICIRPMPGGAALPGGTGYLYCCCVVSCLYALLAMVFARIESGFELA